MRALRFFQQGEIVSPGETGGSEVIQDDEYRNGAVGRDDDRARNAWLRIDPMVPFFSSQHETREFKDQRRGTAAGTGPG